MPYKYVSQTSSGWEISQDPDALRNKRWRVKHVAWGTKYFATHDEARDECFRISIEKMREGVAAGNLVQIAGPDWSNPILKRNPKEELIFDQVYRSCFDKKHPRPTLLNMLKRARCFVLTDEMSAFLADLTYQTFTNRYGKIKPERFKVVGGRGIDETRHFSRLPHKITWVEFSETFFLKRMRELYLDKKPKYSIAVGDGTDPDDVSDGLRNAWLCWQHNEIETAFSARLWSLNEKGQSGSSPVALMWNTESGPLPWRQMPFVISNKTMAPSEWVMLAKGYVRDNVGFHNVSGELETPVHDEQSKTMYNAQMATQGRLQSIFSFLSTLNKIPLVGIQEIKQSRGFVARGQYRKFLNHSIIHLNIPGKADPFKIAHKVTAGLRRRAHQVRGHWRDDWRKPKGNKSLWIAEHQRGDTSLGFVVHDYSVTHEKNPAPWLGAGVAGRRIKH